MAGGGAGWNAGGCEGYAGAGGPVGAASSWRVPQELQNASLSPRSAPQDVQKAIVDPPSRSHTDPTIGLVGHRSDVSGASWRYAAR
ncbi:hypothetical protein GCM10025786_29300 [Nocardioides caeni]